MADLGIRYATALFEISEQGGLLGEYLEQAQFLCSTLRDNGAMRILTHPRIPAQEKYAFLERTYASQVHEDLLSFMRLTVAKNREAFLLPALSKLVEMIKTHYNQTSARVVSAVPLTDAQAAKLTQILEKKLNKQVEITVLVDPTAIAGLSIQVDGLLMDRTVKTLLKNMKDKLEREPS